MVSAVQPVDASAARQARRRRSLLLVAAGLAAGAGVAYELSLMLLGTVSVGATEQANALVLGTAMAGMGVGALTGGAVARAPVLGFVTVEAALAAVGAGAGPLLYTAWSITSELWGPLLLVSGLIGWLIGAEMPLLAALNSRLADQSPEQVVSAYTAADYLGALVGSLVFGFLVRPALGLFHGTAAVAMANIAIALAVGLTLRPVAGRRERRWLAVPLVVGLTGVVVAAAAAGPAVDHGIQRLYRDPVLAVEESRHQLLVATRRRHGGGVEDVRLYLDGDLQLSSVDEHRYHEMLVHPVMHPQAKHVLVLGGGDCLAVREILRHRGVERVTLVELDRTVRSFVDRVPELARLSGGACQDPRVDVVFDDAMSWVRAAEGRRYDAVVVDLPDPDTMALGRLYSRELYTLLHRVVAPDGRIVVQCGSPFFAPEAYWTCAVTLESADWAVTSYHADVPSFGDWGFHLAARPAPPPLDLAVTDQPRRYATADVLRAATVFPPDRARDRYAVRPSTITDPAIVDAHRGAWIGYSTPG